MMPAGIPAVGRMRPIRIPPHAEARLRNGLRVLAIRRPTVPRIEVRLRVPAGHAQDGGDGVRARLLPETILTGTAQRDSVGIARELQRLGASLDAVADADDLILRGGTLAGSLPGLLELLGETITAASFPGGEVAVARDRVAQEILIQRAQPAAIAAEALRGRLFGTHRYGRPLPSPEAVRRIGAAPIRRFWGERVHPRGATLVLVGDLSPDKAAAAADAALRGWRGPAAAAPAPAPPPLRTGRPLLLVDRPGSVQTTIRIGGMALPRSHPDFFSLALATMIFGGYFSSRLVKNIREEKGYTYSPGSAVEHRRSASTLAVQADVGTEVTAAALHEVRYELGRMATLPPGQEELDQARRYLAGATSRSIQTQSGLAGYVDALLAAGLDLSYLRDVRANLEAVTTEGVHAASVTHLSPRSLVTVLVGDGTAARRTLETLDAVEVVAAR